MIEKRLPYWMAVEDDRLLKFSELAHRMAKAIHPSESETMDYAAARINLDAELQCAVQHGSLYVRNPAGLGRHQFPHGDALQRAVLMPHDLRTFLETRGIELRLIPGGNGPTVWTIENAAASIAEQQEWHESARATLQDQMLEAAIDGKMVVRHPHTDLPQNTGHVRVSYELVTRSDVNVWLEAIGASFRWTDPQQLATISKTSPRDFMPWKTLPDAFNVINGVYMYEQAARQIADAEGWDDSKLEALEAEMRDAINSGTLKTRSRQTGMVIKPDLLGSIWLVTVDDVNEWLTNEGVNYRWASGPALEAKAKAVNLSTVKSAKPTKVWDEHELKQLVSESMGQGWAVKDAAIRRGVSRQMIEKMLKKAKEQFGPRKADAFSPRNWLGKK